MSGASFSAVRHAGASNAILSLRALMNLSRLDLLLHAEEPSRFLRWAGESTCACWTRRLRRTIGTNVGAETLAGMMAQHLGASWRQAVGSGARRR